MTNKQVMTGVFLLFRKDCESRLLFFLVRVTYDIQFMSLIYLRTKLKPKIRMELDIFPILDGPILGLKERW